MISASSTPAKALPTNVARPPASEAPPRTAAVMLFRANDEPIWAFPSGALAMTKKAAMAAKRLQMSSALTRTQLVRMPPRLAAVSSKPTARTWSPEPEAWSQTSSRAPATRMTMKAIGIAPTVAVRKATRSGLMIPCAVGRRVNEIPSRMDRVAKVAMIDGILIPRIRPALTSPRPRPARRTTAEPRRIWEKLDSAPIRNEASTTPKLIIAPTERSR